MLNTYTMSRYKNLKIKIWVSFIKREVLHIILFQTNIDTVCSHLFCLKTWKVDLYFIFHLAGTLPLHHKQNQIFFYISPNPFCTLTWFSTSSDTSDNMTHTGLCSHWNHWGYSFRCVAINCLICCAVTLLSNFSNIRQI